MMPYYHVSSKALANYYLISMTLSLTCPDLFSHVFTGARSVCLEIFLSCTACYNTAVQHKPTSSAVRK